MVSEMEYIWIHMVTRGWCYPPYLDMENINKCAVSIAFSSMSVTCRNVLDEGSIYIFIYLYYLYYYIYLYILYIYLYIYKLWRFGKTLLECNLGVLLNLLRVKPRIFLQNPLTINPENRRELQNHLIETPTDIMKPLFAKGFC